MRTAAVCLEGVGVTFPGAVNPLFVDVDLEVSPGEIVGIVGPNGVGKTTLLNVVSLLLRPNRGRVLFSQLESRAGGGTPTALGVLGRGAGWMARSFQWVPMVEDIPTWRYAGDWHLDRLAALAHARGQIGAFLAAPLLAWVPSRYRRRRDTTRAAVIAALERLGFTDEEMADRPVDHLSLGVRRLVDVLRALRMSTVLFVLDEPFANLRPETANALCAELRRHAEGGVAGLVADHNADVLTGVANRVLRLTATGLVPA